MCLDKTNFILNSIKAILLIFSLVINNFKILKMYYLPKTGEQMPFRN